MQRMVPAIANVDCNFAKLSFKDWMSRLAFHVVGGLIEVSNSWDVTLLLFTEDVAVVVNHNCSVVQSFLHFFPLQDGSHDDHVVLLGQLTQHLRGFAFDWL